MAEPESTQPPADSGALGGLRLQTDIMLGKTHVYSDVAMAGRAVRERWPIPEEKRPAVVTRLLGIVAKTEVTVLGPEGEAVTLTDKADTNATRAAQVLSGMMGQNQRDEHHAVDVARGKGIGPTFVQVNFFRCPPKRPPNLLLPSSSNGQSHTPHRNGSSSATPGTE